MRKEITEAIKKEAHRIGIEEEVLKAFVQVETGGIGFDSRTGKIIIQFEPHWFKRKAPYAPSGKWSVNKVERQSCEWIAFNSAFRINRDAAMESTSIGLGQIMGFHYKRLGYISVGAMWDDAKRGLDRQVYQMTQFINTDAKLKRALQIKDWHTVAVLYNGKGYVNISRKYGREPYNISLQKAYNSFI